MPKLILLRHGQSMWNKENLFTGWVDVPLSAQGIEESIQAGQQMCKLPIDIIFSSTLVRGLMTAMIVMAYHHSGKTPVVLHAPGEGKLAEWSEIHSQKAKHRTIPVICNDALNERMYGDLQGLNKQEMREQFGDEQVQLWRRSYAIRPPGGESLEMTINRAVPYFHATIVPHLDAGKNVFVSAHGNSLRGIIKCIDGLSDEAVAGLELATGVPMIYEYNHGKFMRC
jgi:2,3-bisphosphoglycerate-dependent phosphoglycerate mutase